MQESQDPYALMLPAGEEGPFTREELCALLRLGKAREGDRVRVLTSGLVTQIDKLIPEVQELIKSAQPFSDRIKRKSHERKKVVIPLPGDSEVPPPANPVGGISETAAPAPAKEIAQAIKNDLNPIREFSVKANSPMSKQVNAGAPPENRLREVKFMVSLVAIPLSLWWIWYQSNPTYKVPPMEIVWSTQTTQGKPSLPNLRIVLSNDTLKITCDGTTSTHKMVLKGNNDGATYHLTPAHPLLGGAYRVDASNTIITSDQKRIAMRSELISHDKP